VGFREHSDEHLGLITQRCYCLDVILPGFEDLVQCGLVGN
jgi:hypothetical protein